MRSSAAPVVAMGLLLVLGWSPSKTAGKGPRHYVYFGEERARISERAFLDTAAFEGAQLRYTWRELEPEPGRYDFSAIRRDLDFLAAHGKRLFIQLQDSTFADHVAVPRYLMIDARFHGGAVRELADDGKTPEGWVARRWDPAVQERFFALFAALGKEFDGRIEGINLPETAIGVGEKPSEHPSGFTPAAYRDAVIAQMGALKRAFPRSVALQYANFMPGEWRPDEDRGLLRGVYDAAKTLGMGVGGPDLLPGKPGQMGNSYPLIAAASSAVPVGMAVQDGNYAFKDPRTGKPAGMAGLTAFARDYLHADYLFWCTEEPYYSRDVVPFMRRLAAGRPARK